MYRTLLIACATFALCVSSVTAQAFSFFEKDNEAKDLKTVVKQAVGPYEDYSAPYNETNEQDNSYINLITTNIGIVDKDMTSSLEDFVSLDRAKTEGVYLGQINLVDQSMNFAGINGAVWGYHLAKAKEVVKQEKIKKLKKKNDEEAKKKLEKIEQKKPLLFVERQDGENIPVYNGDSIVNAARELVGTKENKRYNIRPGAEVKTAMKKHIASGPKYVWNAVALCVPENREESASLIVQDAGEVVAKDEENLKEYENKVLKDMTHAAIRTAADNDIKFKEIWTSFKTQWVPKGKTACALTAVPYIKLAENVIPRDGGSEKLLEMSATDWVKSQDPQLEPLAEMDKGEKETYTTEHVKFETRKPQVAQGKTVSAESKGAKVIEKDGWTPMQVALFNFHYPKEDNYPNIYGLRLGLPITYSDGSTAYGLDLSAFFSSTTKVKGLQSSVIGTQADDIDGLQISLANYVEKNFNGMQLGGLNYSNETEGFQLGIVNYSKKAEGVQLGIFNVIENGWIPYTIGLNFNFSDVNMNFFEEE